MNSKACKLFLLLYVLFFIGLLVTVLCTEQGDLHLLLTLDYLSTGSVLWNAFQDIFFKYITELGAWGPFIVAVFLLFYKVGDALVVSVVQLMAALVVYPIKVLVAAPRPSLFFNMNFPDVVLHQVDGVALHAMNSFPSGHTAAVFSLMLCLTIVFQKRIWLAPIFFVLALLTAYSRIYLSQHFAEDVLVGSMIGVVMTLLTYWLYQRKRYAWEDESLIDLCKK